MVYQVVSYRRAVTNVVLVLSMFVMSSFVRKCVVFFIEEYHQVRCDYSDPIMLIRLWFYI